MRTWVLEHRRGLVGIVMINIAAVILGVVTGVLVDLYVIIVLIALFVGGMYLVQIQWAD